MRNIPNHASNGSRVILAVWLLTTVLVPAQQPKETPTLDAPHPVKPEMELLITDPVVVDSAEARYPGALSFGHLMEQLAGKEQAGSFTLEWLKLWLADQVVNGDTAPARRRVQELVIDPWRKYDQYANDEDDDPFAWTPNLAHAPFKLIAVVNRMDLMAPGVVAAMKTSAETAQKQLSFLAGNMLALTPPPPNRDFTELSEIFPRNTPEGERVLVHLRRQQPQGKASTKEPRKSKDGQPSTYVAALASDPLPDFNTPASYYGADTIPNFGEGRLIFALTDQAGKSLEPAFTVIFEYSLRTPTALTASVVRTKSAAEAWAARWHHLGTHKEFDDAYLRDLVSVTKLFTEGGLGVSANDPRAPAVLSQLRTNDGALEAAREFRQFSFVAAVPLVGGKKAHLRQVPLSQTPAESYRQPASRSALAVVLKARAEDFRKELPINLPPSLQLRRDVEPTGLFGARALLTSKPLDFHWTVAGVGDQALVKHFSLHTCNGCHGGDTRCEDGCHVKAGDQSALLSSFLSSNADGLPQGEMKERITILKALLELENPSSKAALARLLHQRHRGSH